MIRPTYAIKFTVSIFLVGMFPVASQACGWWGDGEMIRHHSEDLMAPDGTPVPEILDQQTAKLPGREGYGLAVSAAGNAVPYLQATYGRALNRISELKSFGFKAVIDVGTAKKTAQLHRVETETVGMRYYNIPVKGGTPSIKQASLFSQMVMDSSDGPLLVYAPTAALLGTMWASHRLNHGAPLEFSIKEGKLLGITAEQEAALRRRAQAD